MSLPVGKDQVGMNMPSRLSKSLFFAADRQLIPATVIINRHWHDFHSFAFLDGSSLL